MATNEVRVRLIRMELDSVPHALLQVEDRSADGQTTWQTYEIGGGLDQRKEGICEATMALWNLLALI